MAEQRPENDAGERKDQREQAAREEAQRDEPRTDREDDAAQAARSNRQQKGQHKQDDQ